ncbi:MAG: hypothetical protein EWM47_08290 [Anaerolineaceae bacterium]|nr:MAG: hypothetical protein EWM47_08290 [Anaerolineaceae bacterium]
MADDGLLHTAELLKTALPYVDVKSRLTLELLVKLYELIICMRNFTNNDISACGFENEKADMEALLNNIRPKCNKNEQAFVDKMLNVFQAKRMFEMYNTYMEAMNAMQGFDGFGAGDDYGSSADDTSTGFMNSFKDFDFSSIFGGDFNTETFLNNYKTMSSDNTDEIEYNENYEDNTNSNESSNDNTINNNWTQNKDTTEETGDYDSMFEELKSMITPDQMQTYENLRMLFGSMSYDDNNKPNENKEH